MNLLEKKMVDSLIDLKENHNVVGIKAEFEAEGTRFEEAIRLKEVVTRAGLELTIKIGGCEAIKDLYDAKIIGVNTIVAPMIESPYAIQKFIQSSKIVFPEDAERTDIKFLINLETICGCKNLDEMLESPYFKDLAGIVFGRTDMTCSLGMDNNEVNHEIILKYVQVVAEKTRKYNKELVVGGGFSALSFPFLKRLPKAALTRFETRKVIFDAKVLSEGDAEKGLLKAVNFEIMWLKNKQNLYNSLYRGDIRRTEVLQLRYNDSICESNQYVGT